MHEHVRRVLRRQRQGQLVGALGLLEHLPPAGTQDEHRLFARVGDAVPPNPPNPPLAAERCATIVRSLTRSSPAAARDRP